MTKEQEEARNRLHALIPHLLLSEQLRSPDHSAMFAILDTTGNTIIYNLT